MARHITIEQARSVVHTRQDLARDGWRERRIAQALADGSLRRLQRNRYVLDAQWVDLWPESRHRIEAVAAFGEMRDGGAVAAYESAAVVWNLPLYRHAPAAVHVTIPGGGHLPSRRGLCRHTDALPPEDVTTHEGIRCTTLERTVFDLARTLPFEAAVAAADAGLRTAAYRGRRYDERLAAQWRERMLQRAARASGRRGIRQATEVIGFADGRAESPAESVGRVQLHRLGFRGLRLQVAVAGPNGRDYRVDVELEELDTFVEIDGMSKYQDEALRSGRTIEQVLIAEKRREDWIRGVTQHRLVRIEEQHVVSMEQVARRLAAFGIPLPR